MKYATAKYSCMLHVNMIFLCIYMNYHQSSPAWHRLSLLCQLSLTQNDASLSVCTMTELKSLFIIKRPLMPHSFTATEKDRATRCAQSGRTLISTGSTRTGISIQQHIDTFCKHMCIHTHTETTHNSDIPPAAIYPDVS